MFACIDRKLDQRRLYFSIDKLLRISDDKKIGGIYVIFKDDICLYVGQSKNIASRLSTHLCGKYKNVDKILIFEGYEEIEDLIPSEKCAIQIFKPIENILADYTEKINMKNIIFQLHDFLLGAPLFEDYQLIINDSNILIFDINFSLDLIDENNNKILSNVKNAILDGRLS